jgi:type-F conjugative transfer system secretin TraK
VYADISKNELTRIHVDSDRIKSIKSIKSISNNFDLEKDEENGQIFIVPRSERQGPITIFLMTESGKTISLHLTPKNIPSQTLQLLSNKVDESNSSPQNNISYENQLFEIIKAMHSRHLIPGYQIQKPTDETKTVLFHGLERKEVTTYKGKYIGQVVLLKNNTDTLISLKETNFRGKNILAIAIQKKILMPSEVTEIYLVSEV